MTANWLVLRHLLGSCTIGKSDTSLKMNIIPCMVCVHGPLGKCSYTRMVTNVPLEVLRVAVFSLC